MAKISISGDFRVSPEASDVILGRRCAAAQKKMLENMVRSTLLFFPHVWWPFGLEFEVLRVHMYLHVNLKF